MRDRLGLLLVVAVIVVLSAVEGEAACRAGGEYRVTGPNSAGYLTLTETSSDDLTSSGTAVLLVGSKQACPVCSVGSHTLTGRYQAAPGYEGCDLGVNVRHPLDPVPERIRWHAAGRLPSVG